MDSRLRQIADYLLAQKDSTTVDPAAIDPEALPYVYIIGIERDSNVRLRVRLVGTALDRVFQRSLVGRLLEDFIHGPRGGDVIAAYHRCARTREAIWMRQIVQLKNRAPRYVEGVAVHLEPDRIYGGLVVGELASAGTESGFERIVLPRASG